MATGPGNRILKTENQKLTLHAHPNTETRPEYAQKTTNPGAKHPPFEKSIGRHWTTLGDFGGHMSPSHAKIERFRTHEAEEPVNRHFCNTDMRTMRPTVLQSRIDLRSRQIRNSRSDKEEIPFRSATTPATIRPSLLCCLLHFKRPATSVALAECISAAFFPPVVPTK